MTVKEFDLLALDGHNYPTWAVDIKVSLASRGLYRAVSSPEEGVAPLDDQHVYTALYLIRSHIHPDLKAEYLLEENPRNLWNSLKQRYEQQKALVLPAANYEWTQLRLQDFKTVSDYNHAVHRICSKLQFCEKEPTDADKIEKTLSTMLPFKRILQQQYRERRFQVYSELIQTLLEAEKHSELMVWNNQQRPVGSAPLPEVHAYTQNKPKFDGGLSKTHHQENSKKGQKYEAHFNIQPDTTRNEACCSQQVPMEPSSNNIRGGEDLADTGNMIVEYVSNDIFGDFE
ncbi:uncharacterized protein [Miscanthus floridulus]|uniref:uncharacterized protein n=1 Tax=Miscanthus floridulus TaxID=154761 RepID=UPI0034586BB4